MVEYDATTQSFGNLTAICPDCGCLIHRIIGAAKLDQFRLQMRSTFPQGPLHIREIAEPSLNSNLR